MKLSRKSIERLLALADKGASGGTATGKVFNPKDHLLLIRARAALLPAKRKPGKPRDKGQRGERDAIAYLRDQGFAWDMKRGLQSRGGGAEQADVMNAGPFHVEVKRVEKLNIHAALQQACDDAAEDKIPLVLHRRNHDTWKVTLRADDFFEIFRESEYAKRDPQRGPYGNETGEPVAMECPHKTSYRYPCDECDANPEALSPCENGLPDCGPATTSDAEGVPLCERCAEEMARDSTCHAASCPCFMCSGDLIENPEMSVSVKVVDSYGNEAPLFDSFGEDMED